MCQEHAETYFKDLREIGHGPEDEDSPGESNHDSDSEPDPSEPEAEDPDRDNKEDNDHADDHSEDHIEDAPEGSHGKGKDAATHQDATQVDAPDGTPHQDAEPQRASRVKRLPRMLSPGPPSPEPATLAERPANPQEAPHAAREVSGS